MTNRIKVAIDKCLQFDSWRDAGDEHDLGTIDVPDIVFRRMLDVMDSLVEVNEASAAFQSAVKLQDAIDIQAANTKGAVAHRRMHKALADFADAVLGTEEVES